MKQAPSRTPQRSVILNFGRAELYVPVYRYRVDPSLKPRYPAAYVRITRLCFRLLKFNDCRIEHLSITTKSGQF